MNETEGIAFSRKTDMSFESAVTKITKTLKEEGFGILTEIDVKAVLKEKLGRDFRKYVILGACNPVYAEKTLDIDPNVGLLLPCNVIVYESDDGRTIISAVNPVAALDIIHNEDLRRIAAEVSKKLKQAVEEI